uniref:uncharacterized protein LOC100184305 isoform X2 n=1 Tax=Ciona intestinalis TaxID=7719 RepID=UPI000EF4D156|nr:uncharacterized protein LOC100184305 isoform X2 [Ciona intestinalis]|eukprot:XP_026696718.1 uncharacterized protein LOC100184305 isoform X2 [Ciona intestinalis]
MKATSAMRVVWFFTTLLVLFSLHGASVTATQTCGGQITGTGSGRVMSPYHPQKYPKNASCVWTIVVDVGSGLRLEVEHLNNKELSNSGSTGQCYDTLDIYQVIPAGTERRITPSLCASSVAELTTNVFEVPAIGGSTVIRIRFKSDYAIQLSGFSISYKAMCNVTVQNSTGVLTSPGYPSLYPENIVCMTRIITPQDTTVHFSFEQFILEDSADCTSDSLTINTNQGSGIRSVGKKYCGNKNPGQIVATSNDVTITFISDGSFPKLGFIAKWSTDFETLATTARSTTFILPTTLSMVARVVSTFAASSENIVSGSDSQNAYGGNCSRTASGTKCQRWDRSTPHVPKFAPSPSNHNFCRNLDGDATPWCYTMNAHPTWEYCDVETCQAASIEEFQQHHASTDMQISTTVQSITAPPVIQHKTTSRTFKPSNLESKYTGTCSRTATGITCQRWDVNQPHSTSFTPSPSNHNFCRPLDDDATPWCYTTDASIRWEYCNVENCASDTPVTTEATTMDVSTTTDALGALLPVTINAGEVQPKTNNGTQDKSFNRKDELNNNQWFIYVVVVFLLFAIIATVIVILILRRRKKRSEHPPVPGEVAFRQLEGDENGDPEWRPRENTYVEIPFLNQDLPLSVGFTPTPSLPGRQASSTSLDSVAEAKIKATEEDKVDEMNGGYSMGKDVTVDQVQTAENPYTLANDEPEFMLNPLPENGLADNPYQQIDYAAMESPKLPTSTTASKTKSTKKPWSRIFKKAQSEKSLGVAKPQLSQIKNRPPQPAPRNNIPHKEQDPAGIRNPTFQKSPQKDECSPELKPEESVKNNNPTAPGKSRQSMTSLTSEDVFEDNTTYNHYQSPTDIHEKFPSLSISASCCNDTVTCAKEGDTSCYDCPTKCVLANAPVPHDSFKVCISPDIIDKQEETDSWYASPTSPQFELQQTSALYDVPKGSSSSDEKSRGNSNASTTTDDSYCSMVRTKPMKPKTKKHRPGAGNDTSVYTTMQPGAHFENKSYGMHK